MILEKVKGMKTNARKWLVLPVVMIAAAAGCQALFPFVPERISRLFDDSSAGLVGKGLYTAVQIDPSSEDSAGPQLIATGDMDGDGLIDVATVWN